MAKCQDGHGRIVYYGAVNIVQGSFYWGVIDVWKCRECGALFADDRRVGDVEPKPGLGFDELAEGERWAILICGGKPAKDWQLVKVRPGTSLEVECGGAPLKGEVDGEFRLQGVEGARLILLEDVINETVDLS